jgi:nucleoside-diphosphate-sugar epimerase
MSGDDALFSRPQFGGLSRAIVTGGSGFVGRHLVGYLRAAGISVVAPARKPGFEPLRNALPMDGVDHVFHLAARTGVVAAWEDPVGFFDVNALGTVRILDQCRSHGCSMTYVSAYVYGAPSGLPIAETDPATPDNPYAWSKIAAEAACRFFFREYGVRVTILRPFNIYGPGQSERFLLPRVIKQIKDSNSPEIVVADLWPRRDYVFIDDVIDAIVASLATAPGSLYNVGSGVSYSVEDAIKLALRVAGVDKPYRVVPGAARRSEIEDTVADITRLHADSGWLPRVSLESGLRLMIE